jgi:hypothetical protein
MLQAFRKILHRKWTFVKTKINIPHESYRHQTGLLEKIAVYVYPSIAVIFGGFFA